MSDRTSQSNHHIHKRLLPKDNAPIRSRIRSCGNSFSTTWTYVNTHTTEYGIHTLSILTLVLIALGNVETKLTWLISPKVSASKGVIQQTLGGGVHEELTFLTNFLSLSYLIGSSFQPFLGNSYAPTRSGGDLNFTVYYL